MLIKKKLSYNMYIKYIPVSQKHMLMNAFKRKKNIQKYLCIDNTKKAYFISVSTNINKIEILNYIASRYLQNLILHSICFSCKTPSSLFKFVSCDICLHWGRYFSITPIKLISSGLNHKRFRDLETLQVVTDSIGYLRQGEAEHFCT